MSSFYLLDFLFFLKEGICTFIEFALHGQIPRFNDQLRVIKQINTKTIQCILKNSKLDQIYIYIYLYRWSVI